MFIVITYQLTFIASSFQGSFDSDTDTAESDDEYMDYDSDKYIKVRLHLDLNNVKKFVEISGRKIRSLCLKCEILVFCC